MGRIEWTKQNDGTIAGNADFIRYIAYDGEQETWQNIHDARVAKIALANGYVKLEPGQVVVKGDDIKELLHLWNAHGPRFAEINRVMRVFAGAVALVECSTCRGSGTIRVPHPAKPFAPDYIDNCDNCKGTGFVSAALDASGGK
jgi:hypothetical protein